MLTRLKNGGNRSDLSLLIDVITRTRSTPGRATRIARNGKGLSNVWFLLELGISEAQILEASDAQSGNLEYQPCKIRPNINLLGHYCWASVVESEYRGVEAVNRQRRTWKPWMHRLDILSARWPAISVLKWWLAWPWLFAFRCQSPVLNIEA